MYEGQRKLLRRKLRRKGYQLGTGRNHTLVANVDSFQGQEREVIILSCVRSVTKGNQMPNDLGFLQLENRPNVAITRARSGLIIVGNCDVLMVDPYWRALVISYVDQDLVICNTDQWLQRFTEMPPEEWYNEDFLWFNDEDEIGEIEARLISYSVNLRDLQVVDEYPEQDNSEEGLLDQAIGGAISQDETMERRTGQGDSRHGPRARL